MDKYDNIISIKTRKTLEKSLEKLDSIEPKGQSVLQRMPSSINVAQILAKIETQKSIAKLVELRDGADKQELQRQCANDLLNRAWGLPAQSVQITSETRTHLDPVVIEATSSLLDAQKYLSLPLEEWPDEAKSYFGLDEENM